MKATIVPLERKHVKVGNYLMYKAGARGFYVWRIKGVTGDRVDWELLAPYKGDIPPEEGDFRPTKNGGDVSSSMESLLTKHPEDKNYFIAIFNRCLFK